MSTRNFLVKYRSLTMAQRFLEPLQVRKTFQQQFRTGFIWSADILLLVVWKRKGNYMYIWKLELGDSQSCMRNTGLFCGSYISHIHLPSKWENSKSIFQLSPSASKWGLKGALIGIHFRLNSWPRHNQHSIHSTVLNVKCNESNHPVVEWMLWFSAEYV